MTPYYADEKHGVVLYCADALEALECFDLDHFDSIVMSPPYNLKKKYTDNTPSKIGRKMAAVYANWYDDSIPEAEYQEQQKRVLSNALQVCRGSVFYNHRLRYAWQTSRNTDCPASRCYHPMHWIGDLPLWCEIIWDRGGATVPHNGRCLHSDERIYQFNRPAYSPRQPSYTTVWRVAADVNDTHPCAFPVEIPRRCIEISTQPGMLVCDPYSGSATTGVACLRTGRRYVGIESNEAYCEAAAERLRLEAGRFPLFEQTRPKQQELIH